MDIEIASKYELRLLELARASGRTVAEVVDEIVRLGLERRTTNGDGTGDDDGVWKPKLIRFLDEMKALPIEGFRDEFSGADQDDVLYPRSFETRLNT